MTNQDSLFIALEFANHAHRNQKRKLTYAPYIIHPVHVVILLQSHRLSINKPEELITLMAGAVHDSIEDNPQEVSFNLLETYLGREVALIVQNVSLDPENPDKELSRKKILNCNWQTRIVKVADILSNTIGTLHSVMSIGLNETQKCFKQPIHDRIRMEKKFLKLVCKPEGDPQALHDICDSAMEELNCLEKAIKT